MTISPNGWKPSSPNNVSNLIEALAEAVAKDLLTHMDKLDSVRLKVRKPEAPIPAIVKDIAVEITRSRKDYAL